MLRYRLYSLDASVEITLDIILQSDVSITVRL